jgi:hypothetical protein
VKRLLAIIAIVAISGIMPWLVNTAVHAQTPTQPEDRENETTTETETETEDDNTRFRAAREKAQDARATALERREALCTIIQDRLTKRGENIQLVTETHLTVYQNLLDRLDTVIQTAEEKEFDTTKLTAAYVELTSKVENFRTVSDELIESIATGGEECTDETRFGTLISNGRTQIRTVREAAREIRTTFREVVVPELREYRSTIQQSNTQNSDETETSDES